MAPVSSFKKGNPPAVGSGRGCAPRANGSNGESHQTPFRSSGTLVAALEAALCKKAPIARPEQTMRRRSLATTAGAARLRPVADGLQPPDPFKAKKPGRALARIALGLFP